MATHAAVGLGMGMTWGVAARVWMRLITTDTPEFSWSGTLMIVGFAGLAGLGLGLVRGARVAGRRRRWRLCAAMALLLAIAPQGIFAFLPAFVLGGLAWSGRGPGWVRLLLLVGTLAVPAVFITSVMSPADQANAIRPVFGIGLLILMAGQALGGSVLLRRWSERNTPTPTSLGASGEPSLL